MPSATAAWILTSDGPPVEIWGLSPEERLRRSLSSAGCRPIVSGPAHAAPALPSGPVALFRSDAIVDDRLVAALALTRDSVLVDSELGAVGVSTDSAHAQHSARAMTENDHGALDGLKRVRADELVPPYVAHLRKIQPAWLRPARAEEARAIEAFTFEASYKGATDLVTKWVWPRPAASVTRWCARRRITPNSVTLGSWGLAALTTWLFAEGQFGAGLVAGWLMTFLDTVDGKLARVTLSSSRLGHVLDHGLDLVHPPFWYLAWGLALGPEANTATAIVVGGYVLGRLLEGGFLAAFRCEIHSWQPLDSLFRTLTARRNPNLLLLSVATLGGRPDLGMWMVALWTLASLGFHAVRLVQAALRRRRGTAIEPWVRAVARPSEAAGMSYSRGA